MAIPAAKRIDIFLDTLNFIKRIINNKDEYISFKINSNQERGHTVCLRIMQIPTKRVSTYLGQIIDYISLNDVLCLLGPVSLTKSYDINKQTKERIYRDNVRTMYMTLSLGVTLYGIITRDRVNYKEFHSFDSFYQVLEQLKPHFGKDIYDTQGGHNLL